MKESRLQWFIYAYQGEIIAQGRRNNEIQMDASTRIRDNDKISKHDPCEIHDIDAPTLGLILIWISLLNVTNFSRLNLIHHTVFKVLNSLTSFCARGGGQIFIPYGCGEALKISLSRQPTWLIITQSKQASNFRCFVLQFKQQNQKHKYQFWRRTTSQEGLLTEHDPSKKGGRSFLNSL